MATAVAKEAEQVLLMTAAANDWPTAQHYYIIVVVVVEEMPELLVTREMSCAGCEMQEAR